MYKLRLLTMVVITEYPDGKKYSKCFFMGERMVSGKKKKESTTPKIEGHKDRTHEQLAEEVQSGLGEILTAEPAQPIVPENINVNVSIHVHFSWGRKE